MYGAGRDPPLDVVLANEIRERFGEYADATGYISSMIDSIAKFDFDINPMLVRSNALLERWREGRRLYGAQEYEDSYEVMDHLTEDVKAFMDEVLAFKDQALFWVYITEWVAVTGTFLLVASRVGSVGGKGHVMCFQLVPLWKTAPKGSLGFHQTESTCIRTSLPIPCEPLLPRPIPPPNALGTGVARSHHEARWQEVRC
jgi:hypothetical protein